MKEVYTSAEIEAAFHRIFARISGIGSANRFVVSRDHRPVIHTRMQTLFNVKFNSDLDRSMYEILMTHALAAEKLGPGGFNRTLELVLEYFDAQGRGNYCQKIGSSELHPTVATAADVRETVTRYASLGGYRTVTMVQRALELAGFAGRIIIEKTTSTTPSVELVRGYTFELQQLLPIDVSFVQPRVSCIDGYVESVSEIHHLLEAASSAKEPCVVFLRGCSEDVKHTLKVNYDRGSLRVVPVSVRFDLEGMNTLVDLSISSGCDLTSSLKGDLISGIKFSELPYVDQVTIYKGRVVITNSKTQKRVSSHVAELRSRRMDVNTVDDVGKLLDKRIKSLSPNHVVIRLPNDKEYVTNSQAIDYALRAVKSIVDHGVTEDGKPIATEYAAKVYAQRCLATLSQVGAYVV